MQIRENKLKLYSWKNYSTQKNYKRGITTQSKCHNEAMKFAYYYSIHHLCLSIRSFLSESSKLLKLKIIMLFSTSTIYVEFCRSKNCFRFQYIILQHNAPCNDLRDTWKEFSRGAPFCWEIIFYLTVIIDSRVKAFDEIRFRSQPNPEKKIKRNSIGRNLPKFRFPTELGRSVTITIHWFL